MTYSPATTIWYFLHTSYGYSRLTQNHAYYLQYSIHILLSCLIYKRYRLVSNFWPVLYSVRESVKIYGNNLRSSVNEEDIL